MAAHQRAILVRNIGKALELGNRHIPSPASEQVLVRVKAVMVLPHDAESRDHGLFIADKLPYVLGGNIAGTVEKIGSDVSSFQDGDRVFGITTFAYPNADQGGLQEYALLEANAISRIPPPFTYEQVATLPTNLVTATVALFTQTGLDLRPWFASSEKPLDYGSCTVVILAAGTNVGKFAVQVAKLAGIGTIVAVAGPVNRAQLLHMGATHFFDRHASEDKLVSDIHAITRLEGATHILDCYNRTFELARALLPTDEASVFRALHPIDSEQAALLRTARPLCDAKFIGASNAALEPHTREFWSGVYQWLQTGDILPTQCRTLHGLESVAEINEALDDYRDRRPGPQLVVQL